MSGGEPPWVRRIAVSFAFAFGTWAGCLGIYQAEVRMFVLPALAVAIVAVLVHIYRRLEDIYPLSVVLGSLIIFRLSGDRPGPSSQLIVQTSTTATPAPPAAAEHGPR